MISWVWDPAKAASNLSKHGVSFAVGRQVLDDPLAITRQDPHPDGDRWQTIGVPAPGSSAVILVVHTDLRLLDDGSEIGRIISVRRATQHERRAYEEGTP